jgi:mannose-6-phosphate isomerase-like protein (cupin superfamily)
MRTLSVILLGLALPLGGIAPVALSAQARQAQAQQPPATPPATQPQPSQPAPKPPAKPATGGTSSQKAANGAAARALVMTLQVTSRKGAGIGDVKVAIDGPVTREAQTDDGGIARLPNVKPGTYRVRFEHPQYIAFEKELTLKPGQSQAFDVSLDDAPAPPPPPPTPAKTTGPALGTPGDPKTVDIANFVEKNLISGRDPMKRSALGCSGLLQTDLVQIRDPLPERSHDNYDETLYVVAGQGTLKMAGHDTNLEPASFVLIPRGTAYSLSRRGNKPLIVLSTYAGEPCGSGGSTTPSQK